MARQALINELPKDTDHPPYKEKLERLNKLKAQRQALYAEINDLNVQAGMRVTTANHESARLTWEGKAPSVRPENTEIQARIAQRHREARDIEGAIKIGEDEVAREIRAFSADICSRMRPEYTALIRRMVEQVLALSETIEAEEHFRDKFVQNGLVFGLPNGVLPGRARFTNPERDPNSVLAIWLRDLRAAGYID